jgi:hypothetical protein
VNVGNDVDSSKKNISSMESLWADILREIQCPRCPNYLTHPITMCQYGHNICNSCQAHISPYDERCTGLLSGLRNVALENTVANIIYPCPFATLADVRCDWSGIPSEIGRHVENSHSDDCLRVTERSVWIYILGPSYQKAIFSLGKLFFSLFSTSGNDVHFALFHVGHKNDSSGYIYDFKIGNSDKFLSKSGVICYHYQDGMMVLQNRNYVYFPLETIMFLFGHTDVSCAFQIKEGNQPMERMDIPTCQVGGSNFEADIPSL